MSAAMLPESHVAIHQTRLDRRKFRSPHVFLPQQLIYRPRPGGGLTYARGEYDSVYGRIASDWKIENGALSLRVHTLRIKDQRITRLITGADKIV